MHFRKSLAKIIIESIKNREPEIRYKMLRYDGRYESVDLEVVVKIEENAVKSFHLSNDNPVVLRYEIKAIANVIDHLQDPDKIQTVTMSKTVDPALIVDGHNNILENNVARLRDHILNELAHQIAMHCKTETSSEKLTSKAASGTKPYSAEYIDKVGITLR